MVAQTTTKLTLSIFKDGELVGAIGVSGATAEQDEEVANHAVS